VTAIRALAAMTLLTAASAQALPIEDTDQPGEIVSRSAAQPWRTFVLLAGAPRCPACVASRRELSRATPPARWRLHRAAIAHVDVDALPGGFARFAARHHVPYHGTIPIAVVFRAGVAVAGFVGALDARGLEALLARADDVRLAGAERRRRSCGRSWSGPCLFVAP
jgi:thioredoxin-like negative regulator of GroEL